MAQPTLPDRSQGVWAGTPEGNRARALFNGIDVSAACYYANVDTGVVGLWAVDDQGNLIVVQSPGEPYQRGLERRLLRGSVQVHVLSEHQLRDRPTPSATHAAERLRVWQALTAAALTRPI